MFNAKNQRIYYTLDTSCQTKKKKHQKHLTTQLKSLKFITLWDFTTGRKHTWYSVNQAWTWFARHGSHTKFPMIPCVWLPYCLHLFWVSSRLIEAFRFRFFLYLMLPQILLMSITLCALFVFPNKVTLCLRPAPCLPPGYDPSPWQAPDRLDGKPAATLTRE